MPSIFSNRLGRANHPPKQNEETSAPLSPRVGPLQVTVGPAVLRSAIVSSRPTATTRRSKNVASSSREGEVKLELPWPPHLPLNSSKFTSQAIASTTSTSFSIPFIPPSPTPSFASAMSNATIRADSPSSAQSPAQLDYFEDYEEVRAPSSLRSSCSSSSSSSSAAIVTTPPPPVHVLNRIPIVGPDFELESNLSCGSSFEDFDGPASSIWGDVLHHRPSFSSLLSQEDEGSRSSRTSLDGQSDAFNITADTGKIPNSSSRVLLAPSPSGSSHHRPAFRQASPSESPSTSSLPSSALPTQSPELPTRKVRFVTPLQLPPPPKEYKLDLKRIRDGGRRLSVVEETSPRDAMKLLSAMLS